MKRRSFVASTLALPFLHRAVKSGSAEAVVPLKYYDVPMRVQPRVSLLTAETQNKIRYLCVSCSSPAWPESYPAQDGEEENDPEDDPEDDEW